MRRVGIKIPFRTFAWLWPIGCLLALGLASTTTARAQNASRPLITQAINEASTVTLVGNTRAEARDLVNDRGVVPDSLPLPHMLLQLRRPAAQEQALNALIDQLHDSQSPNYHHWLNPAEVGAQFGPAASDITTISGWLTRHGFTVNSVYPNGMVIDFSGTAGQVRNAFHTEIHNLSVNGVAHIANMSDPQIPAALAPAVVGIVSLHDFKPRPGAARNPAAPLPSLPKNYTNSGNYWVTPADLATIYNFNPVFAGGNTGQGQTIYLIEDSDLYTSSDWTTFRSGFGIPVSSYPGASLTTIHPGGCTDPGANGDGGEASLDAEYASAAAPSAAIVMATCAGTASTGGWVIAIENLLSGGSPPAIVSMSYISCETNNGASANAALSAAYQTGVAAGTSIIGIAGDEDASVCNYGGAVSTYGIGVNAMASTPFNLALGGTDFADTYLNENSTYWNSTNSASYGSAKSYIPEIPWNSTCGSQLSVTYNGFSTAYGSSGFCNSSVASSDGYLSDWGASGGPSGCATGTPALTEEVGGTCAGYPKPSWQAGLFGNPADGVRDLPDVSFFASFGPWNHGFVICWSDPSESSEGATPCTGAPSNWSTDWGGTSFDAPIYAGVQALINKSTGERQGNPAYRLYQLAAKEYGTGGSSACNSSNGNTVASSCIFYDVTLGDNDAPCKYYAPNCYDPDAEYYGVLSTSTTLYQPAFKTTAGWDFATGIGTINVANLVSAWVGGGVPITNSHDFNGDTKSDILWRDTSGNMAIWEMLGTTILNPNSAGLGGVSTSWSIVGQHDFNSDGKADLLWHDTSGNLAIWEMSGTTILNPNSAGLGAVSTVWTVAGVGDFNGDGKADILWRNTTTGDVAIWEMNGTTVLNPSSSGVGNVATNWSVVGVGDFNGDGKADILWQNNTNGNLAIYLMNGTTITSSATFANLPSGWSVVGIGDFNGDGKSDILLRDTAGDLAIWEMNGTTILNPNSSGAGNLSTTWSVAETGDFNGDGKTDILWHDTSGDIAIWFMNGTTLSSGTGLGTIPTTFAIQGTNAD
jgi:hypothetical protein